MFEQYDDKEEELEYVPPALPKLEFTITPSEMITCDTVVVALHGPSSLFAAALVLQKNPHARINFSKAKQSSLADVFFDRHINTVYVIFNDELQKMKEIYFSQFLTATIIFNKCIVFQSLCLNNLNKASSVCLQHLKTSSWSDNVSCNKYEEGLMGPSADMLVFGQINKIPVLCYLGIFGDYELNKKIIDDVFGSISGKHGFQQNNDISDKIKKYNMKKYSNNIYL